MIVATRERERLPIDWQDLAFVLIVKASQEMLYCSLKKAKKTCILANMEGEGVDGHPIRSSKLIKVLGRLMEEQQMMMFAVDH